MHSGNRHDEETLLLQEEEQARKIANTQKAEAAVAAVEMTDVSLIFGFKEYLAEFMEGLGHTIMFPIAGGASLIRAILKLREAYLAKGENKKGAVLRAAVETVTALAISTAVVGTFVATASFALAGPIIFTVALAAKTLFHLGATIYYGVKAALTQDASLKQNYLKNMKTNFVITVVNSLTTVAAGLVFIGHQASFGLLGLIGGALGAAYAAYKAFTIKPAKPAVVTASVDVSLSSVSREEPPHSPSPKLNKGKEVAPAILGEQVSSPLALSPVTIPSTSDLTVSTVKSAQLSVLSSSPKQSMAPVSSPVVATVATNNTASILQQTLSAATVADLRNKMNESRLKAKKVTQEETQPVKETKEVTLTLLKNELSTKRTLIGEGMRKLERRLGANHAFSRGADTGHSFGSISTYWWDKLYAEKFSEQSEITQALMTEVNANIETYNNLIASKKELLQEDSMRQTLANAQAQRADVEAEELRNKEFKERTGMTKGEALDLANLLGLGGGARI